MTEYVYAGRRPPVYTFDKQFLERQGKEEGSENEGQDRAIRFAMPGVDRLADEMGCSREYRSEVGSSRGLKRKIAPL